MGGVTPDRFRRLVLALPEVKEWVYRGWPDFHVGGRVMASLDWPEVGWAMVCLAPSEAEALVQSDPATWHLPSGARRKPGSVLARLETVEEAVLQTVLRRAWHRNAGARIRVQHASTVAAVR